MPPHKALPTQLLAAPKQIKDMDSLQIQGFGTVPSLYHQCVIFARGIPGFGMLLVQLFPVKIGILNFLSHTLEYTKLARAISGIPRLHEPMCASYSSGFSMFEQPLRMH